MRFLRLPSLAVAFLGLQFALVGERMVCPAAVNGSAAATQAEAADVAMAGMAMPVGSASGARDDAAHAPSPTQRPCDESGAPRSCQAAASCATAFAVAVSDRTPAAVTATAMPVLTVLAPASFALAPELPPPRA